MGLFDMLAGMLKARQEKINILVIGLNNSGKSTIVNHFKDPEERSQVCLPTVGFNVEKFQSECLHSDTQLDSYFNFLSINVIFFSPNFQFVRRCRRCKFLAPYMYIKLALYLWVS